MMDNKSIVIKCDNLKKYLEQLKYLLTYNYKVYVRIENESLKVFGSDDALNKAKNLVDYFNNADSQYYLAVNNFSKDAFEIDDLILLFESKCKVLIVMGDSTLCLYGVLKNVNLLYSYFLKYDHLVRSETVQCFLAEDEATRLEVMFSQLDIKLSKHISALTRVFIYNILLNRDCLFNDIELNCLSTDFCNINAKNDSRQDNILNRGDTEMASSSKEKIPVQARNASGDKINTINDNISKYRTIIIDGNNLAFGHGGDKFSSIGIKIAIDYFVSRGHTKIYALLPRHRQALGGTLFEQLEREDRLKYTPSRILNNVRETPYDDRFILDAALFTEGVVLSNDQYRDLMNVDKYRDIICNRLIPYTFIEDHLIIPDDPRGSKGPSLGKILSNPTTKSPKKPHKKAQKSTPISKPTPSTDTRAHTQSQTDLKGHQITILNTVREILPTHAALIRQVILGNPTVFDANVIMNLVLMASQQQQR